MIFDHDNYRFESRGRQMALGPTDPEGSERLYVSHVGGAYSWEQVLRVLRKNIKFVGAFAILTTAFVAIYAFHIRDTYLPIARLQIDPPGSGALSPREAESSFEFNQEYLETQLQILQSDELATRVIRALHMDRNPEIVGEKAIARFGKQLSRISSGSDGPAEGEGPHSPFEFTDRTPLEDAALRVFHSELRVGMVRGSRLVELGFGSHDPHLAKQVTNNLVSQFIDQNFKTRYQSTMQASDWLSVQLNDLRQKVETSNQAVVDYQRRYGLIEEDEKDGPTSRLVSEASHQLSDAQADRIQMEAFVRMIEAGQAESLPQIHASPVYQAVTSQYAEASAKLAEAKAIYGEENTNYKKLQNEVNELSGQRAAEEARIITQIHTSYDAARERERLMLNSMSDLKAKMGDMNERMVRYRVLKNDAQANAELYNTLLGRLKEAGLYAGLKSSNIRVVDAAALLDKPTGPHRLLIISVGAVLNGLLAIVLAFARESLNNTVRTPDDAWEWTGLPSLAIVPLIASNQEDKKSRMLPEHSEANIFRTSVPNRANRARPIILSTLSDSLEAEALRDLRTSILLSQGSHGRLRQVLLVASSAAEEGKSTVAINLAMALSMRGRTCLMDGDLRRPSIADAFGGSPASGWDQILSGGRSMDAAFLRVDEFPNLFLLPVSAQAANPGELIASGKIKELIHSLRGLFEFVVIDSPPAIPFSDARILGPLTDGVVLVGRWGLTTRRALTRCVQRFQEVGAPIVGIVVNAMDFSSADYQYYNFGYSSGKWNGYGRYKEAAGNRSAGDSMGKAKGKSAGA